MKMAARFFACTVVLFALFVLCSCAMNNHPVEGGNHMNANLIMLDARIIQLIDVIPLGLGNWHKTSPVLAIPPETPNNREFSTRRI
jgi:hypothetical protein